MGDQHGHADGELDVPSGRPAFARTDDWSRRGDIGFAKGRGERASKHIGLGDAFAGRTRLQRRTQTAQVDGEVLASGQGSLPTIQRVPRLEASVGSDTLASDMPASSARRRRTVANSSAVTGAPGRIIWPRSDSRRAQSPFAWSRSGVRRRVAALRRAPRGDRDAFLMAATALRVISPSRPTMALTCSGLVCRSFASS